MGCVWPLVTRNVSLSLNTSASRIPYAVERSTACESSVYLCSDLSICFQKKVIVYRLLWRAKLELYLTATLGRRKLTPAPYIQSVPRSKLSRLQKPNS